MPYLMHILAAYQDFSTECSMMGYSNTLKDKIEFYKMFKNGDYDYILED
jgi:hypothetical protein